MDDLNSKAIALDFETGYVRVAGEAVSGHVDINIALAEQEKIERVRVKLIGCIKTSIHQSMGGAGTTHWETIPLINSEIPLRERGRSLLPRYPFQFVLPSTLLPSFYHSSTNTNYTEGAVKYFVEVVAKRDGLFRVYRNIRKVFPVVPAASQSDIRTKALLMGGWRQGWNSIKLENRIRRWPRGGYSHVLADFTIPALSSFPISTPIPFHLLIVTETKPLRLSEAPSPFTAQPLFPEPPNASQIDLCLIRHVEIRARHEKLFVKERVTSLGGMGDDSVLTALGDNFRIWTEDPEWMPQARADRGVWRRRVYFESFMTFSCPPSFNSDTLSSQYILSIKIPFSGYGNDLKSEFPITINSGVGCLPPPYTSGSRASCVDASLSRISLMMDLQPAYWACEGQKWDDGR